MSNNVKKCLSQFPGAQTDVFKLLISKQSKTQRIKNSVSLHLLLEKLKRWIDCQNSLQLIFFQLTDRPNICVPTDWALTLSSSSWEIPLSAWFLRSRTSLWRTLALNLGTSMTSLQPSSVSIARAIVTATIRPRACTLKTLSGTWATWKGAAAWTGNSVNTSFTGWRMRTCAHRARYTTAQWATMRHWSKTPRTSSKQRASISWCHTPPFLQASPATTGQRWSTTSQASASGTSGVSTHVTRAISSCSVTRAQTFYWTKMINTD